MSNHDFQMPEAIEAGARDRLGRLFGSLTSLQQRLDAIEPIDGGMLVRENARTAYEPIENQVHILTYSGLEPLQTCSTFLEHHGLPMLSLYPLIRASIEAGAFAQWLLAPGTSKKRTFRSLLLTKKHREDADETTSTLVALDPEKTRIFQERMEELKTMTPGLETMSLDRRFPNTTDVLLEADRHITTTPHSLTMSWRICSGLAHSNMAMHHRVLERRQDTEYINGVAQFHMTSSFEVIERLTRPAVQLLSDVITRLETRASER